MGSSLDAARGFIHRSRRWLAVIGGLVVLYTAVGFLVLPWVLRRQAVSRLSELLARPVSIERVRVNPYALSLTVEGFRLGEKDGAELLGFERLYVNVRALPALRREIALDAIELVKLRAKLELRRDGTLNVDDLVRRLSGDPAAPEPARAAKPSRPWVLAVERFALDEASVTFADRSRARPFDTTVGPFTIRLERFRTDPEAQSPYAFRGTTDSGESFSWSGFVRTEPLRSRGTIVLEGLRLPKYAPYYERSVGFDLRDGRADVRSAYELEWSPARQVLRLSEGALSVRDLALALRGAAEPAVRLSRVEVAGLTADVMGGSAEVASVTLAGGAVHARRSAGGEIDLLAMAGPPAAGEGRAPPAPAPPAAGKPGRKATVPEAAAAGARAPAQFRWKVRRIELRDQRVEVDDALPARPVRLVLAPVAGRLEEVSSDPASTSRLSLTTGVNGTGTVALAGTVSIWRPSVDLAVKVSALELPPLDPYLPLYGDLDARMPTGRLEVDGRARSDLGVEPLTWSFEGDVRLDGFALRDGARGEELVRWSRLELEGVRALSQARGYAVRALRWTEPRLRLGISEDGSSNLARVLAPPAAAPAAPAGAAPPPPGASRSPAPAPVRPAPWSVALLQIDRGGVGVVDRSIAPPAVLSVSDLAVRVRGLSSDVAARAQVDVTAKVSGAPFSVKGTLSPRMVNDATELKIGSKGIDLTPLGPYAGRYVGYELDKGKLDLELAYRVANRHLEATNVVRMDQLTLGRETGSPQATKLPVRLGLAVLQDRNGLIDLDVPVSGDVDDPDFSLGKVIWHAVVNVFTKIATQPFAALGSLFGGGDRLDVVQFEPGSAAVSPAAEKTLDALARALQSRPALRLDVDGSADEAADGAVLRREALRAKAREAKWKAARDRPASPDLVQLAESEYAAFVRTEYQALKDAEARAQGARPAPLPASLVPAELEAEVMARLTVPQESYRILAQQRAEAVRDRIAQVGQVDLARLFLVDGSEPARKEGGARAFFALR
jgi:hypothetical protein